MKKARILIVDDHPNAAFILSKVLLSIGPEIEVITAQSGKEALELVGNDPIQVVITDFLMPGFSGLELIKKLQGRDCPPPDQTILITAYDTVGLAESAKHLRIDKYLTKPVDPEKVRSMVKETIHGIQETPLPEPPEPDNSQYKILIADDNPDNLRLLTTRIRSEGYTYITAKDGQEALDKAWEYLPDLLLLDVDMPRKTGFEVLQEIRTNSRTKDIQVLMISAVRTQPYHIRVGLNLGADDYIVKPIDWHELNARIRSKLRVKRAEDTLRHRNQELALLPEIAQDLSARLDLGELTNIVLQRTALALNATNSNLVIFQPDGSIFHMLYADGSFVTLSEAAQKRMVEGGLISHVMASRQGVIVRDTENDDRWLKSDNIHTRSAVAVPLLGRSAVIGVLTLTHINTEHFNPDHKVLLQAIGSQVAIAVENAQLYTAAEQEHKRLEAVLNVVGDAIMVTDNQNNFQRGNPAVESLFGQGKIRLNKPLPDHQASRQLIALTQQAKEENATIQSEIRFPGNRTFQAQATPIIEEGSVIVLHDITHFKELERVKNEFIAAASHDLKNPIASMLLSSNLVKRTGPLNLHQEKILNHIDRAAMQMHQLVTDILDLSSANFHGNQVHEPVDISLLLEEIHDEYLTQAIEKDQSLELKFLSNNSLLHVQGEKLRLQQVFRNIIGNAVKYTPNNGRISILAELQDNQIEVQIQDSGIGIPEEDLQYIFEAFYRAKMPEAETIEGTGLGLAIVKSIINQHNGRITVTSTVGKGTIFTITLPQLIIIESPAPEMAL